MRILPAEPEAEDAAEEEEERHETPGVAIARPLCAGYAAPVLLLVAACAPPHVPHSRAPAASGEPSVLDGPAALAGAPTPDARTPEAPYAAAPPLEVAPLDESALAALLRNEGEALLVVNFWATWCRPCVQELPLLRAAAAEGGATRFVLVSVDARRDRPRLAPFLTGLGVRLPAYHLDVDDASGALGRVVPGWPDLIPVTLVVEPGGAVRARFEGAFQAEALRETLAP